VSGVVVDTSVWIDFLAVRAEPALEDALRRGAVVLPPVVVAELISGAHRPRDRAAVADLVGDLELPETPLEHWVRVGELRRRLRARGATVSTPDAHVAQCAIDRDAVLLARDPVFPPIARWSPLRLAKS
jgi:predicted nucleic acid-binding protein